MYVYTREKSNENPGVLNSCTYIGSVASTYGIAVLSDRIGWSSTLLVWALLAFAGTLICMRVPGPGEKNSYKKLWKNLILLCIL